MSGDSDLPRSVYDRPAAISPRGVSAAASGCLARAGVDLSGRVRCEYNEEGCAAGRENESARARLE